MEINRNDHLPIIRLQNAGSLQKIDPKSSFFAGGRWKTENLERIRALAFGDWAFVTKTRRFWIVCESFLPMFQYGCGVSTFRDEAHSITSGFRSNLKRKSSQILNKKSRMIRLLLCLIAASFSHPKEIRKDRNGIECRFQSGLFQNWALDLLPPKMLSFDRANGIAALESLSDPGKM